VDRQGQKWAIAVFAALVLIAAISSSTSDERAEDSHRPASDPVLMIDPARCPAYFGGGRPSAGLSGVDLATGTNPLISVPTQSPIRSRSDWIRITPTDNIQAIVDSKPAGSTFLLTAGVYEGEAVRPRHGDAFVGQPGTVLSGGGVIEHAFRGGAHDVTICGLVIENYANPAQTGAINGDGVGWRIVGNEIRNNAGAGVTLNDEYQLIGNGIHHNRQIGIKGAGADILIQNNEISHNNINDEYDMSWEAGGAKFLRTEDLVVRGNFVHDNHGHGLWTDSNNVRSLYEDNLVVGNYGAGIFHEISYDAIIRGNQIEANGYRHAQGGIRVVSSRNVEIATNRVTGNNGGIYVAQTERGEGIYGRFVVENLWVHDNYISFSEGWSGLRANDELGMTIYEMNNRFDGNTYQLEPHGTPFIWRNRELDVSEWRLYGLDTNGSFD
jgi:parallel beta-helix repeat protein